jgi:hypothetical protein
MSALSYVYVLCLVGCTDANSAWCAYACIMAGHPCVTVFREACGVCAVLRPLTAGYCLVLL